MATKNVTTDLPGDQSDRDAAARERDRNVLIDAGAGTGKTTTLVKRVTHLVAPDDDGPCWPLARIAAITFTRKAAGELRLRIREQLLATLAIPSLTETRRKRLHRAVGEMDAAWVGTIHGFADRLLRQFPVETGLSPAYDIVEDPADLVAEAADVILKGAQTRTLHERFAGTSLFDLAAAAETTLTDAIRAGIPVQTKEFEHAQKHGLESLLAGFVDARDVTLQAPAEVPFDEASFRDAAQELTERCNQIAQDTPGSRWLKEVADLAGSADFGDLPRLYRELNHIIRNTGFPPKLRLKVEFEHDKAGWAVYQAFNDGKDREGGPLKDALTLPLRQWLTMRLVRTAPVMLAIFEQVKARHGVVDQLDLLIRLRDLLRDCPQVRAACQGFFDHILVDEFQDTDPLQAEIVLFLCEDGAKATRFDDVVLGAHRLTVVGDPQQSIYRFRRADIAMYDLVRRKVLESQPLVARLSVNFRSRPELIGWFNDRLGQLLGLPNEGKPDFDPIEGTVTYQSLQAGAPRADGPTVQVIRYSAGTKASVGKKRPMEAEAVARYLRWLVDSGYPVRDPLTGTLRPVGFGDIAVLNIATTHLPLLFAAFDRYGIPYSSRGGKLFLEDALHRQFLLGLRAIADPSDGIAQAALMRPPFFALDLQDLLAERAIQGDSKESRVLRAREAKTLVQDLRMRRFQRSPGATARDLLERTGLARSVALGPNGAQRLQRLRDLCLTMERIAAEQGLDFDATTAQLREWVSHPIQLDPPPPVDAAAVQVLTVFQAKGLEFPVTVWWDASAKKDKDDRTSPWRIERDGSAWAVRIDGIAWDEPTGSELSLREARFRNAERLRLVYVATTRARDLLLLPMADEPSEGYVTGALLARMDPSTVSVTDVYTNETADTWPCGPVAVPGTPVIRPDPDADDVTSNWKDAAARAGRNRFAPGGVAAEAHAAPIVRAADPDEAFPKERKGRFGPTFGETVHKAIGHLILGQAADAEAAVRLAAAQTGLDRNRKQAVEDVARAHDILRMEGLLDGTGSLLRIEYPVAFANDGRLLVGYIDFLAQAGGTLHILDFKTDPPPQGSAEDAYPAYVEQVRTYARVLATQPHLAASKMRLGLLFTADGGIREVTAGA